MKKLFLNLGKTLSKKEQKNTNGGAGTPWDSCITIDCPSCSKCVVAEPYPYCEPDPTQMCYKDPQ